MHIISMTAVSYVIALLASLTVLWFFGRLDGEPIITIVGQTVVLGVAGSAGSIRRTPAAPMTKLEKNWLEWICFAISLLLVISLLGYLL